MTQMCSPDRSGRTITAAVRAAVIGLIALALGVQGYLVGAHSHPPVARTVVAAIHAGVGADASRDDGHREQAPDPCPICQSIALAWALLPVDGIQLVEPLRFAAWYALTERWAAPPRQASHRWRSRAPPAA